MIENNRFFWSHLKTRTTTVRVECRSMEPAGVIFKVGSMIDIGKGRQMAALSAVECPNRRNISLRYLNQCVAVPFSMGVFDFLYTSRKKPVLHNVNKLLSSLYNESHIETIVPEVITPGDLLVFEYHEESSSLMINDCLRIVQQHDPKKSTVAHAL